MLRQAFKDARQVEAAAVFRVGTAGKVPSENFSYTPLPRACDSTTAEFVAMRRPSRMVATKSTKNRKSGSPVWLRLSNTLAQAAASAAGTASK
ncbi:MAG TPA: hypothetical protein VFQ76_08910, partial [Longimicrobiaceae bacterium]|nr:hypothetical protein [Longimicrobiaceae bacterium]